MGSLGLLIATSAGLATARGQDSPRPAGAEVGAGQSTELLITHALDMALEGSELQLTIRQAGGPVVVSKTDDGVARTNALDGPAGTAGTKKSGLIQLQHQVRRSFQESYELMKAGNRLLRGGAEAREERASASRLYAAANLYANTLYSLGRQTFGWQAGWDPADRSTPDRAGQDQEPGTTHEGGPKLTTADLASITLINHSVKESLSAFEIKRSLHHRVAGDAAAKLLRDHAHAMAKESRQSVEQLLASLHERAAAGTPEPKPGKDAAAPAGQEGWSGTHVQALAQQAREVIRVLDELGSETGAAPGGSRGGL
jgi:hypothetical protein